MRQTNVSRSPSHMHDCPRVTRVPSEYELACLAGAQAGQVTPKYRTVERSTVAKVTKGAFLTLRIDFADEKKYFFSDFLNLFGKATSECNLRHLFAIFRTGTAPIV